MKSKLSVLLAVVVLFALMLACMPKEDEPTPYPTPRPTEIVPFGYTNLSMTLTANTPEFVNDSNWKVKLINFDDNGANLAAGYGDTLTSFSIAFNEGEWTGGEGTAKLVVRNDPVSPWVEVWTHVP